MYREPFDKHRRHLRVPLVVALVVAAQAGAGLSSNASPSPEVIVPTVLTAADDGRTVELRVGAEVVIQLPDNPSTGYRWEIEADKSVVDIKRHHFEQQAHQVGGGGESSWVLQAIAPGVSPVKLMLWRPWESERDAIQRFVVTLRIAP
ncbi:protease inhibitor I42 family protein [Ideonella sp.]|uniref:protease inhibitor I42 family protein n=1 Tax=Ideonella sp. TaxID=1929293 RepID=UPI0035B1AE92